MTTLTLPFGSFTPTQPAATISVLTQVSDFADVDHALGVVARGGFRSGSDPLDNPLTDPPIVGPSTTTSVTPQLITITKHDNAPESETATGPNFARLWNVARSSPRARPSRTCASATPCPTPFPTVACRTSPRPAR
ncbi:MAG: hypothetical protein M5U19_14615 [Microthrixaceae bacterium]|nr:hypothetical protein [Microthrixaceae bacterium]